MKRFRRVGQAVTASSLLAGWLACAQPAGPAYENNFEQVDVGKLPPDMLVLDGAFAVRQEGGNRFLELPGAPLESYGVLFGPTAQDNVEVSARVFGTSTGKRAPTFAVGLNGAGGYRLQVSPGRRALDLYQGDLVRASLPYTWTSGQWTWLRLRVRKVQDLEWRVEGRAWAEGATEPAEWMISLKVAEAPKPGRAGIFGSPFADTPIRYDDLTQRPMGGQ